MAIPVRTKTIELGQEKLAHRSYSPELASSYIRTEACTSVFVLTRTIHQLYEIVTM